MASRLSILSDVLTGAMGQSPARVKSFLGSLDEATAARLIAAAEEGDNRTILKAMADQTWGAAPARVEPPPAPPAASRDPVSFRDRIANDPNIRAGLEDAGISTAGMTGPEALKAYVRNVRGAAPPRGRPRAEDAIRELAKPADQVAAESVAKQFDRAVGEPRLADDLSFDEVPPRPPTKSAASGEWSDEARAASAIAAGTGAAFALDAAASSLMGGGNPAELKYDIYDRPDPFALQPADPVRVGNKYFYQDHVDYDPLDGFPADAVGKPLPLGIPPKDDIYTKPDPFAPLPADPVRIGQKYFYQDHFDYDPFGGVSADVLGKPLNPKAKSRKSADLTESGNPAELAAELPQPTLLTSGRSSLPAAATATARATPPISPAPEPPMPVAPKPAPKASPGPTTDFSGTPDNVLEQLFQRIQDSDNFIPNPQERHAVMAEYYRRRFDRDHPDNVRDDLDAAANPVTPDPEVKPKPAVKQPSLEADLMTATNPQARLYQDLINRGFDRDRALSISSEQNPAIQGLLVGSRSPAEARDQRLAAFERRDAEARGLNSRGPAAPSSTVTVDGLTLPSVLGSDGQPLGDGEYYTEGSRRAAERARAAAITRAGGPRGVPGPRTNDGRMPTPAPEFTTPEEAEAYYTRPRDPQTGALLPSQADVAMEQRGLVPTFGEDGEAHYQMGYSHLRGAGQDVRRNLQQYTNHRVPGTNTPAWQMESKDGPTGTFAAMVPTDALRQYNATQAQRASLLRNAARGSARAMQDLKAMGDLTPAEEVRLNNMLAERERADRFATMARLAGGSQGLRGGAGGNIGMFQALAMLEGKDPQKLDASDRARMYSLPGGREAAAVDAANNTQLRDLGLRVATGQGFQQPLPEQRELARQQLDAGKPVQVRAQERAADGELNHPDVTNHANAIVDRLYSRVGAMGNTSRFTDREVEMAAQRLADDLGIDISEALPIMQSIQEERSQNMLASGIVAAFYDR